MSSIKPRRVGQDAGIPNSSITTSSTRVSISRPENSRSYLLKSFAQALGHFATGRSKRDRRTRQASADPTSPWTSSLNRQLHVALGAPVRASPQRRRHRNKASRENGPDHQWQRRYRARDGAPIRHRRSSRWVKRNILMPRFSEAARAEFYSRSAWRDPGNGWPS